MYQTHHRMPGTLRYIVDITPGARWRLAMRTAGIALLLAVVLPVLWFLGALTLLGLMGAVAAMLIWGMARNSLWPRGRRDPSHGVGATDEL